MSPYRDPDRQRQAAAEWARGRRQEWLDAQSCHRCGADPTATTLHVFGAPSSAWTARRDRRDALLADAAVLCDGCVAQDRAARAEAARVRKNQRRRVPADQQRKSGRKPGPKAEKPAPRPRRERKTTSADVTAPRPRRARKPTLAPPSSLTEHLAEEQRREERRRRREERRAEWRSGRAS